MSQLSKLEWTEWLGHPVTKIFRSILLLRREELKEQWAMGVHTDQGGFATGLVEGRAIGAAQCLLDLLQLDEVTVNQELTHDE